LFNYVVVWHAPWKDPRCMGAPEGGNVIGDVPMDETRRELLMWLYENGFAHPVSIPSASGGQNPAAPAPPTWRPPAHVERYLKPHAQFVLVQTPV
jgi:hypothetical protein